METDGRGLEGLTLDAGFVAASTLITAGLAFVLSQIAMVITAGGNLRLWGIALLVSGEFAIVEWVGVFAGAMLTLSLTRRREVRRRSAVALLAGVVGGFTTSGVVLIAVLLFGAPQLWPLAALSAPVAGVVSGLCARARPVSPEVLLRQRSAVSATIAETADRAESTVRGDGR